MALVRICADEIHDGAHSCSGELRRRLAIPEREINTAEADILITTYLNSRLSARTASLARESLADARSQTSSTRAQSSDDVAVR